MITDYEVLTFKSFMSNYHPSSRSSHHHRIVCFFPKTSPQRSLLLTANRCERASLRQLLIFVPTIDHYSPKARLHIRYPHLPSCKPSAARKRNPTLSGLVLGVTAFPRTTKDLLSWRRFKNPSCQWNWRTFAWLQRWGLLM